MTRDRHWRADHRGGVQRRGHDDDQRRMEAARGFRMATFHSPAEIGWREPPHGVPGQVVSDSSRRRDPRRSAPCDGRAMIFERRPPRRVDPDRGPWVALVGAGPGDPDLLTRRGRHDCSAPPTSCSTTGWPARRCSTSLDPTPRDRRRQGQGLWRRRSAYIEGLMVAHHDAGARVVRLKGGDPFVFGRGHGGGARGPRGRFAVEVVPGISRRSPRRRSAASPSPSATVSAAGHGRYPGTGSTATTTGRPSPRSTARSSC